MNKQLIAVPDCFHYWKVVRADNPSDAVMCGLDEHHAKRWAKSTQVPERDGAKPEAEVSQAVGR